MNYEFYIISPLYFCLFFQSGLQGVINKIQLIFVFPYYIFILHTHLDFKGFFFSFK
jgi:hypothetical protein